MAETQKQNLESLKNQASKFELSKVNQIIWFIDTLDVEELDVNEDWNISIEDKNTKSTKQEIVQKQVEIQEPVEVLVQWVRTRWRITGRRLLIPRKTTYKQTQMRTKTETKSEIVEKEVLVENKDLQKFIKNLERYWFKGVEELLNWNWLKIDELKKLFEDLKNEKLKEIGKTKQEEEKLENEISPTNISNPKQTKSARQIIQEKIAEWNKKRELREALEDKERAEAKVAQLNQQLSEQKTANEKEKQELQEKLTKAEKAKENANKMFWWLVAWTLAALWVWAAAVKKYLDNLKNKSAKAVEDAVKDLEKKLGEKDAELKTEKEAKEKAETEVKQEKEVRENLERDLAKLRAERWWDAEIIKQREQKIAELERDLQNLDEKFKNTSDELVGEKAKLKIEDYKNFKIKNWETDTGMNWNQIENEAAQKIKFEWWKERIQFDVKLEDMGKLSEIVQKIAWENQISIKFKYLDITKTTTANWTDTRFVANFNSPEDVVKFFKLLRENPEYQKLQNDRTIDYNWYRLDKIAEYTTGFREGWDALTRIITATRNIDWKYTYKWADWNDKIITEEEFKEFKRQYDEIQAKIQKVAKVFEAEKKMEKDLADAIQRAQNAENDKKILKDDLTASKKEIEKLKWNLAKKSEELRKITDELAVNKAQTNKLKADLETLRTEQSWNKWIIDDQLAKIERHEEMIWKWLNKTMDAEEQVKNLTEEIEDLKNSSNENDAEKQRKIDDLVKRLEEANKYLVKESEDLRLFTENSNKEIGKLQQKVNELTSENQKLTEASKKLRWNLTAKDLEIKRLRDDLATNKIQTEALKGNLDKSEAKVQELQAEIKKATNRAEVNRLNSELTKVKKSLDVQRESYEKLLDEYKKASEELEKIAPKELPDFAPIEADKSLEENKGESDVFEKEIEEANLAKLKKMLENWKMANQTGKIIEKFENKVLEEITKKRGKFEDKIKEFKELKIDWLSTEFRLFIDEIVKQWEKAKSWEEIDMKKFKTEWIWERGKEKVEEWKKSLERAAKK